MSQMAPNQKEFHFPESIEMDGNKFSLIYDPGNPTRPQVLPNYQAMLAQPTSACEVLDLDGMGRKFFAIVDAVMPAMSAQQAGGYPVPEKSYLCFKLMDFHRDPTTINPRELVIYEKNIPMGAAQGLSRSRRILNAVLGSAAAAEPKPDTNWTQQMAEIQAHQGGVNGEPEGSADAAE